MTSQDDGPPVMASDTASPSPGLLDNGIIRFMHELRELAHDHLELAALETRLSVNTALTMAIIAIVTAIVLASAWMALVGSAALGLIGIGLAPPFAMLLLGAANFLLGFVGWQHIRRKSRSLGWPATQRALEPRPLAERQGVVT
jgi:uncharacterized membrane protein YqjE